MLSAISFLTKGKPEKITLFLHRLIIALSLLIIIFIGPYLFYNINFMDKIYPNIYVAGVNVGGLSKPDAIGLVMLKFPTPQDIKIIGGPNEYYLTPTSLDINYNYQSTVDRAYNLTRTGNFIFDSIERLKLIVAPKKLGLSIESDEFELRAFYYNLANEVSDKPISPSIKIIDGIIEIDKGKIGNTVDVTKLMSLVGESLALGKSDNINLPINLSDPTLTEFEIQKVKIRANNYLGKSISFSHGSYNYLLLDGEILNLLDLKSGYDEIEVLRLIEKISSEINTDPQTPKFVFDGTRVTEFAPAKDGVLLDTLNFKNKLTISLDKLKDSDQTNILFEIPITTVKPDISTEEVNDLGIKELIGSATSTYFHSIPGRVFNVNLAASRINGTLIPPGKTFSFNQTLGDVSKFTGYQQAYVILGGKTILGDGGGVCQVSTTLFRSALNAGLPITERSAHAYRVGYYEQNSPPGLDATVYYPTTDFKFTNDTDKHILIQAINNPKDYSLTFELYGTKDGRVSTVEKPRVSNYQPPLPEVYQDDPTLAAGVIKQVDYAAAGSRVTFNYSVQRNGEDIYQKTFVSNYRPWAAVYLRGTKN